MSICPCCEEPFEKVSGSRHRIWYRGSGERNELIIRRLYCEQCEQIHHELPDVLIPYKHYGAESIEPVIEDVDPIDVAADESTFYRWREWFEIWGPYAVGCLTSIATRFELDMPVGNSSDSPQTVRRKNGRDQETSAGWLARVVRSIVNVHLWVQTRFAFLSGFT